MAEVPRTLRSNANRVDLNEINKGVSGNPIRLENPTSSSVPSYTNMPAKTSNPSSSPSGGSGTTPTMQAGTGNSTLNLTDSEQGSIVGAAVAETRGDRRPKKDPVTGKRTGPVTPGNSMFGKLWRGGNFVTGLGVEGLDVYDAYKDPNREVSEQLGESGSRLATAALGAKVGATIGAPIPFGAAIGGVLGGIGGYALGDEGYDYVTGLGDQIQSGDLDMRDAPGQVYDDFRSTDLYDVGEQSVNQIRSSLDSLRNSPTVSAGMDESREAFEGFQESPVYQTGQEIYNRGRRAVTDVGRDVYGQGQRAYRRLDQLVFGEDDDGRF